MMHGNIIDNASSAVKNLIKKGSFDKAYVSLKKCNGLTNEMIGIYNRENEGAIAYSEWEVEKDPCDDDKLIVRERTSYSSGGGGGDGNCCCECSCYLLSWGSCCWCLNNPETVLDCCCNCCCGC